MGLFSSKKKYTVNVTVANVFDTTMIPNSALNGIVKGIMHNGSITEYMLEDIASSIGIRAQTGFHWLQSHPSAIGLPKAGIRTYISAQNQVLQAIAANVGQDIVPEYYYLGPLNSMHFGWQYCTDALGYDPETNELTLLSAQVGHKCYLYDMMATYLREDYDWMVESDDMGMLDQLGPAPTSGYTPSRPFNTLAGIGQYAAQPAYEVSDVATEDYVTITYEFENELGVFVKRGIVASMAAFDNTADFHMCRYRTSTNKLGFFTYQHASGTYPLIDSALVFDDTALGTYLPFTYFRAHGSDSLKTETAETIEAMQKWCTYLGVNYDEMHSGVHKDPDVFDVEQAILLFAINPADDNEACVQYLFRYFSWLHTNSLSQRELVDGLYSKMQAFTSSPSQAFRIADKRFAQTFQYSGIQKQMVPGKIGRLGKYTSAFERVSQNSQRYLTQGIQGVSSGTTVSSQPAWIYRHQVLDNMYEEVAVYGLRVNYEVHSKKGFAAGSNSKNLLIPIDWAILRTIGVPAQEQILSRTLRMQVNTVIVTETPWYASGIMKSIMFVVAIVITILTAGQAWPALVAAAAIGTTALVLTVLTMVVQVLVVQYSIKLFVKELGPKAGFLAAIAMFAAAVYGGASDASWAQSLLSMSTGLVEQSNTALAGMLEDVLTELTDFQAWAAGQLESLQDRKEALGLIPTLVGLDALDVVQLSPSIVLGETPSAYYDRTVHAGNIGAASFDQTEFYVDTMLTLPQLSSVDEDFYDGSIPTA